MKTYKYLLWDLDGTILDFKLAEKNSIKTLFLKYGFGECSDEAIGRYSRINEKYWQKLERNEMTKPEILVKRFEDFFALEGLDVSVSQAFNSDYQITLGDTIAFHDNAYEIISGLRGKFTQAVVTNGTKVAQDKKLSRSGLDKVFDYIFISEEIGFEKPNVEFFDTVKKQMKLKDFSEALIIGDSLTSDMLGGVNANIDTCWYNPSHEINEKNYKPMYEIEDLHEVLKLIGA